MTSPISNPDPYPQFAFDLRTLLDATRLSYTSYLRIRSLSTSPTNPELQSSRLELSDNLAQLSEDLDDLTATVTAVERDPYRFGLDVADVSARRKFVQEVRAEVTAMEAEEKKDPATAAGAQPQQSQGGYVGDSDDEADGRAGGGGSSSDPVAQYEHEQQLEIMREQDQQLEGVGNTVKNLRALGTNLGIELEAQNEELEGLDQDVERVEGKLGRGMRELNGFIRKNEDTASNWCIGLLVLTLCVLLFLLVII